MITACAEGFSLFGRNTKRTERNDFIRPSCNGRLFDSDSWHKQRHFNKLLAAHDWTCWSRNCRSECDPGASTPGWTWLNLAEPGAPTPTVFRFRGNRFCVISASLTSGFLCSSAEECWQVWEVLPRLINWRAEKKVKRCFLLFFFSLHVESERKPSLNLFTRRRRKEWMTSFSFSALAHSSSRCTNMQECSFLFVQRG